MFSWNPPDPISIFTVVGDVEVVEPVDDPTRLTREGVEVGCGVAVLAGVAVGCGVAVGAGVGTNTAIGVPLNTTGSGVGYTKFLLP